MKRYDKKATTVGVVVSAGQAFNGGSEASSSDQITAIIIAGIFIGVVAFSTFLLLWYISCHKIKYIQIWAHRDLLWLHCAIIRCRSRMGWIGACDYHG